MLDVLTILANMQGPAAGAIIGIAAACAIPVVVFRLTKSERKRVDFDRLQQQVYALERQLERVTVVPPSGGSLVRSS